MRQVLLRVLPIDAILYSLQLLVSSTRTLHLSFCTMLETFCLTYDDRKTRAGHVLHITYMLFILNFEDWGDPLDVRKVE